MEANTVNGQPRFNGVWSHKAPNVWVATYNVGLTQFLEEQTFWQALGLEPRFVTAYDNGFGTASFGGMFSN